MKILCVYYSRTGNTEKLMEEIAGELGCEKVRLSDGVDRSGLLGWLRSGMQAMARHVPQVDKPETELPLGEYDLVIIGTPVWAGRCSAPVRRFLTQFGEELKRVADQAEHARYAYCFQREVRLVKALLEEHRAQKNGAE